MNTHKLIHATLFAFVSNQTFGPIECTTTFERNKILSNITLKILRYKHVHNLDDQSAIASAYQSSAIVCVWTYYLVIHHQYGSQVLNEL